MGDHTTKRKKEDPAYLKTPHRGIPDIDNLIKFVLDALNGLVWQDDRIISEIHARKYHSEVKQTIIEVIPLEDDDS